MAALKVYLFPKILALLTIVSNVGLFKCNENVDQTVSEITLALYKRYTKLLYQMKTKSFVSCWSSGGIFLSFLLARPPCAMMYEFLIVLHFLPALDHLPVSDNLELAF